MYNNFIPEVWVNAIQRDLERLHVFASDCNRQYEGEVKQMGDSVKILGVGKPTITQLVQRALAVLTTLKPWKIHPQSCISTRCHTSIMALAILTNYRQ